MLDILKSFSPEFYNFVQDNTFQVVDFKSTPENFGNYFLILNFHNLKLKLYSDRGDKFVDISCDAVTWHQLEHVLVFMNPTLSPKEGEASKKIDELAVSLKENIDSVVKFFKSKSYSVFYKKFESDMNKNFIKGIFGDTQD